MANNGAVGALFATLGLDTAQFSEGIASAQKAGSGFASAFASVGKTVALAGAAMAASAGAAFVTFGQQALSAADDIGDAAARIGVGAEAFQKLQAAATAAGGSPELMTAALDKLNVGLGQFQATGGGPAAAAFKQLGLSSQIASGEIANSEQAFYAIAKAMEGVKNPAEKAALASKLFGKAAGPDMLEVLGVGQKALIQYGDAAKQFGLVMSDEMVERLSDLNLKLKTLKSAFGQFATVMAGQAILAAQDFLKSLQPVFEMVGDFLRPALDDLKKSFNSLAQNQGFLSAMNIGLTLVKGFAAVVGGTLVVAFRVVIEVVNIFVKALDWLYQKVAPLTTAIDGLMKKVAGAFQPATKSMRDFTETARKMEKDVTKNSYVPDMVDEIVRQMARSDQAFKTSEDIMRDYVENAKQIAADFKTFELSTPAERARAAADRANRRAEMPNYLGNTGSIQSRDPAVLTSTDWIDKWKQGQVDAVNDNDRLRSAFASTFSDGLSEALNGNGGNWLKTWWQKTLQNAFQNAMNNLGSRVFDMLSKNGSSSGGSSSGTANLIQTALAFFSKSQGFASGGSGVVGGSGGPDSQFVGLRLTPGELVNVSKPGNDNGGMGGQIVIPVSLGGDHIETIMVDIANRQASIVTGAALKGVSTAQARQSTYARYR